MTTTFTCNLDAAGSELTHVWSHTVGSGRAALALRADWQAQMRKTRAELGVRHVEEPAAIRVGADAPQEGDLDVHAPSRHRLVQPLAPGERRERAALDRLPDDRMAHDAPRPVHVEAPDDDDSTHAGHPAPRDGYRRTP